MAEVQLTGSFVSIGEENISTTKSSVQQLIDIIQSDISSAGGNNTRKKYQVFVSGGTNLSSITSSLYQTVFDQDFTLGTSNSLFDITIGSYQEINNSNLPVVNGITGEFDNAGKLRFTDGSGNNKNDLTMMREKVAVYKQFAQILLGDSDAYFVAPHGREPGDDLGDSKVAKRIDAAVFLSFKRLFVRDNIYKGSFGLRLFNQATTLTETRETNIDTVANIDDGTISTYLINDTLSATNLSIDPVGGEHSTLIDDSGDYVGLIYYDKGIIVLDAEVVFDKDQIIRGIIDTVTTTSNAQEATKTADEYGFTHPAFSDTIDYNAGEIVFTNKFYPDLWVSGSIDTVVDHICETRFGTGTLSSIGFRNETIINSSLIFCRAAPSQLNYSTNPTYIDDSGDLVVLDGNDINNPFAFVTTIGLYDANGYLLAVAKTSRPIEKNPETDLSIRIRLDY